MYDCWKQPTFVEIFILRPSSPNLVCAVSLFHELLIIDG
jgi:hypothetical protein